MRKLFVLTAVFVAWVAWPDTLIKNQGTNLGPINVLNCVGARVTCSRNGSTGTIFVDAGSCASCDAGYGLQVDGGCELVLPPCNPDLGRYGDGGCICSAWPAVIEPCLALDSGDFTGAGRWCLRGDQTMLAGSAITLYPVNSPPTQSWVMLPGGTMETMTRLNDIGDASVTGWNQYFMTDDAGAASPVGDFTTCMFSENMMRNSAAPTNYVDAFVRFGVSGAIRWHDVSGTFANGDAVTCAPSCSSASNLTTPPHRSQSMHCGVFTAGDGGAASGSTAACTYIQGAGTTCVSTAHIQPKITTTTAPWYVGLSQSGIGTQEMADVWFRGAFMTQKALSLADMNRIALLSIPTTPVGETFTRLTDKTCCDGTFNCVNLPPNVPCANGALTEISPFQVRNTAANPEAQMTNSTSFTLLDGGSMNPTYVPNDMAAPWGFTTAPSYTFQRSDVFASDAGVPYVYNESGSTACQSSVVGQIRCSWMVYGAATLDMCLASVAPGQTCSTCTTSGSAWTLCQVAGYATGTTDPCVIGNLSRTAPSGSASTFQATGHFTRSQAQVWITMPQCNPISEEPDYSALGTSTNRMPETLTGATCR